MESESKPIESIDLKESSATTKGEDKGEKAKPQKKVRQPSITRQLRSEIERLEQDNVQLKDQYIRLLAEFDNFRKRRQFESVEAANRTKKDVLFSLLPILDDTDRLFKHEDENNEGFFNGAKLIAEKFRKVLNDMGLKPMDSKGRKFDPNLHEAVMTMDSPEEEAGMVVEVIEPGYLLGNEVLRHAKVVVSK